MSKRNTFTKYSGSTYNCAVCGRLTRDVDQGGTETCPQCYELAGDDNMHNDNGTTPTPAQMKHYEALVAHIGKKGGNMQRVRDSNEYLFPTTIKETTMSNDIDTMNKSDLRAACKAAGIPYGKLTNDGMRDALRAAQATPEAVVTTRAPAVEVPAAAPTVAPVQTLDEQVQASLEASPPVKAAKAPKAPKPVKVPREFRNGVGRPKAEGACGRVWAHLDHAGDMTVADIKAWASQVGLNPNNAAIEIYGWRKFNGIKTVKAVKAPKAKAVKVDASAVVAAVDAAIAAPLKEVQAHAA